MLENPFKPKGDCDRNHYELHNVFLLLENPFKPKGDCDDNSALVNLPLSDKLENPFKPKGDCDTASFR